MTTDRFGAFLQGVDQATRRGLEELRRRIATNATDIAALETTLSTVESYTPALTATVTNPTLGSSPVQDGRYAQHGKLIVGNARIVLGSSSSAGSGSYRVSLPVAASSNLAATGLIGAGSTVGTWIARDFSGSTAASGVIQLVTSTTVLMFRTDLNTSLSQVTDTAPWAWGDSDYLQIGFHYVTN